MGRGTTRHAFAVPQRLGSIRARVVRRRSAGTDRVDPAPLTYPPTADRLGFLRMVAQPCLGLSSK